MGRNGAGKSTLLKTAAALIDPVRGKIQAQAGVALLTQNPSDFLVRERVGDELPGEAGLAALRIVGLEHAIEADPEISRAVSASAWHSPSRSLAVWKATSFPGS